MDSEPSPAPWDMAEIAIAFQWLSCLRTDYQSASQSCAISEIANGSSRPYNGSMTLCEDYRQGIAP
jgi:hypothetical protein